MKKLYLHIGTHKTGTSSIQDFLYRHSDSLEKNNVYYMKEFTKWNGHHNLAKECKGGNNSEFDRDIKDKNKELELDAYIERVNKIPFGDFILSSEDFGWILTKNDISNFKEKLNIFDDIKIIAYFRLQDSYLESFYQTTVNDIFVRNTQSFSEYFSSRMFNKALHYEKYINDWKELFGEKNLIVKNFDMEKKNLIAGFLNIIDPNIKDIFSNDELDTRQNISLDKNSIEILRLLNRSEVNVDDKTFSKIKELLLKVQLKEPAKYLSDDLREEYINSFLSENNSFYRKYNK